MSELTELTNKLEPLIDQKTGVAPTHFWAGIGLTILSVVAIGAMSFGTLSSNVSANTESRKDDSKHTTAITLKSHKELIEIKIEGVQKDLTSTKERVDKLEEKHD